MTRISAAGRIATSFGVLAGLGGITHGVGEILQGNVAPEGIWVYSWTQGPIATNMGGEPGMTLVPNMLASGLLTILAALTIIVWAAGFVERKRGGLVLILLSIFMMLVGGGVGPPVLGILAGVAGLGINARFGWWRKWLSGGLGRVLARLWPWIFGICLANGVFLVIGSVILVYAIDLNAPDLFLFSFYFAALSLPVAIVTGIAYDIHTGNSGVAVA
jgi:hypothetical protein